MEIAVSIIIGIGLATAAGFRVFVPFTFLSVASLTGYMNLSEGFEWIGTYPALIVFGVATICEILAYFFPYVDNLLDTIAIPVATVAGVIIMAASVTDLSPLLKWSLAIIAGGTASGVTQLTTSTLRAVSTTATAGLGNWALNIIESITSIVASILSILLPFFSVLLFIAVMIIFIKIFQIIKRKFSKKREKRRELNRGG